MTQEWSPDPLLPGYLVLQQPARVLNDPALTNRLAAAGRDDPVFTLIRPAVTPAEPRGVVVHLHGYNDYFFHTDLADAIMDAGWAFLAVDARRCGRSLRNDEIPHYQADLREQADDLDHAVDAALDLHPGIPVVVHGHSTGGLVAALWAHAHRRAPKAAGLILDAPFMAVERSWFVPLADPALPVLARQAPLRVINAAPSHYAGRLATRMVFDTHLKRPEGVPARAGWMAAVRAGQHRVARGLDVPVPVLVAHSARSGADEPNSPDLDHTDTVLDVTQIADLAPRIGPHVTTVAIDGGVHDLVLSLEGPRRAYLTEVVQFLGRITGIESAPPLAESASLWPALRPGEPAVVGHRGNSWVAPQNTLVAFESAAHAGATAIELDLQLSADGTVVVIHDDTVDATTDGTGPVANLTVTQLQQLDAGSWFGSSFTGTQVPTWNQVVDLMDEHPSVGLLIELKDDWDAAGIAAVVEPLRETGISLRSVLQSFSRTTVEALADVAPDIPRGLLVEEPAPDFVEFCRQTNAIACNPSGLLVLADPGLVDRLHAAGLQVIVWTLDEEWMWAAAVQAEVDGIITDRPDRLAGWLAGRR